ncbi:MAG: mechanosensitive ion channel family protein [Desulfobacterales bacterium]
MKKTCFRFITKLLLFVLIFLTALQINVAAQDEKNPDSAQADSSESSVARQGKTAIHTEKVDTAGERIGQGVDQIGEWASNHLGKWTNAELFYGITWLKMLICLFLITLVVLIERIVQLLIQAKLKNLPGEEVIVPWSKLFLRALSKPLTLLIWVYGIYLAISPLFIHFQAAEGDNLVNVVAKKAADIGGTIAIIWFLFSLVQLIDVRLKKWASATESAIDDMLAPLVGKVLRVFIIAVGGIFLIQNLTGIEMGPLLASLGIGGLAFALAAKESIANLFGTLTILFDKPFQVGERIIIESTDGVVESVGFRSTRIRTLTGHQVSIPNEKAVNTVVENIGRRPYIRWLTNIGITYDTPPEKVVRAVEIISNILENHEGYRKDFPPRVFFNGFNDCSLNILVLAWYHPPDYWDFQAWLQKTCLEILTAFQKDGIDFAFPSRTIYLANDDKRQLMLRMLKGEG